MCLLVDPFGWQTPKLLMHINSKVLTHTICPCLQLQRSPVLGQRVR